jgi:hypothetical protein
VASPRRQGSLSTDAITLLISLRFAPLTIRANGVADWPHTNRGCMRLLPPSKTFDLLAPTPSRNSAEKKSGNKRPKMVAVTVVVS